jgi:multiple sugar transport system substrate-binding protein
MGMLYRRDILDRYGIPVPTTWDEFATAAQALKDTVAPGVLADFPTNGRAYNQALFAQAGSVPFAYDSADPQTIRIEVNDQGVKDVLAYWDGLVKPGLVATDDAFTADYNTKLVDGSYAVYVAAAWGPGYLQGLADADADAVWKAEPVPQRDPANPVQINKDVFLGAGGEQRWNLIISGAFISVLPLILSFLFLQRYWQGGLAIVSVK